MAEPIVPWITIEMNRIQSLSDKTPAKLNSRFKPIHRQFNDSFQSHTKNLSRILEHIRSLLEHDGGRHSFSPQFT